MPHTHIDNKMMTRAVVGIRHSLIATTILPVDFGDRNFALTSSPGEPILISEALVGPQGLVIAFTFLWSRIVLGLFVLLPSQVVQITYPMQRDRSAAVQGRAVAVELHLV